MTASHIIMCMIAGCAVFAALAFAGRPIRLLARTVAGAIAGAVGIILCNALLAPFGVAVGINAVTLIIVGLLGLPGFIALYMSCAVL